MPNTDFAPYISRQSAEKLLGNFGKALKQPETNPLVFYAYGIGGVGKSTLLEKLREIYIKDAKFATAFFGPTSRINSPLALMEHLYQQLPDDDWGGDAFTELCKKYKETLNQLEIEAVEGKGSASVEQVGLVKKLLGGAVKALASWHMPDQTAEQLGSAAEGVVDAATLALSEKDRLEELLKKHRATKHKRELQELMLDPLPKLTQAFAEGLIQKAKQQPIVLELDTYEKASSEFDVFLCKYLLGDTALQSYPVRIVMAGRYSLKNKRYQRMFQHHWNLIDECQLEKFDKDETKQYLKEIGIVQPNEVRRLTNATKGLPYFLKLIKDQKEDGKSLSTLRDSDEIVDRLLDGLSPTQRQVVQLASYCRWFDRPMIQYLVNASLQDKSQATEAQADWFDWLVERDFVIPEETYRIDDVARDVLRAKEHRENEQNFRHVHDLLAQYFRQLADQEVAPTQPAPAKYENSDWRRYAAESTYHTLFANRDKGQFQLLTYFFEGAYFKQPEVALVAFTAVAAEAEPTNHELLPKDTQRFLGSVQFAIWFGWHLIGKNPDHYEFNLQKQGSATQPKTESIKPHIESALGHCLQKTDRLTGLAKYTGLMSKSVRSQSSQRLALIKSARDEAGQIATPAYPEFSGNLFFEVGIAFESLDLHQEALDSCDKAIELKPDLYVAWHNRGDALQELERYDEALDSYDKAIELKPDLYEAWNNQGNTLQKLERYNEALDSYDKAIELKPDLYAAWHNRGNALQKLERYDEALDSYDKAIELKVDYHEAWHNRGLTLLRQRKYKEALENYDLALQSAKNAAEVWNLRGLCLSFLDQFDEALKNLKQARDLNKQEPAYLANQGIVLARAGRYEAAFALCEQAIKQDPNHESGYYAKACYYALRGEIAQAINHLQKAIEIAPRHSRSEAKHNPDFDHIRDDEQFQALVYPE